MSPELKAFIDSVCDSVPEDVRNRDAATQSTLREVAHKAGALLGLIADALERLGPYACELRPVRQVKRAIAECCARREAIGHHGLA